MFPVPDKNEEPDSDKPVLYDYKSCFSFQNCWHPEIIFSEDLLLFVFELPKFIKSAGSIKEKQDISEWLTFLNKADKEGSEMAKTNYKNPMIHRAFDVLEAISADQVLRQQAEAREKQLKDEVSFLAAERRAGIREGKVEGIREGKVEGIVEGINENRIEMAKNSLREKLSVELIAKLTGLPRKEIENLR